MLRRLFSVCFKVMILCVTHKVYCAVIEPQNSDDVLVNPDMGLVMFHYSNRQWAYGQLLERGDVLDWFPGTGCVYFRLPWCLLEPEEGRFRWDLIDSYAKPWIAAGKQIGLRVTCCEARFPYATPEWVKKSGARGWRFHQSKMEKIFGRSPDENGPELWEPDYGDSVFLEKLEHFLKAMGRRYDGKTYVAFVDVGSIGMYGEGHTRVYHESMKSEGRDPEAAFFRHYELYRKYFPNTTVLCIDDQAGGGWNPHPDPALMVHARRMGFGFRDDSILVSPPPNSWKHANWAKLFAGNAPVFIEHEHYSLSCLRGAWSDDLLMQSIEDNQATWLSIHGWPNEIYERSGETFKRAARRIGYRFELRRVEYPDQVNVGERFVIRSSWVNVGVARCYKGATLCWTLVDDQGRVVWSVTDDDYDFASALPKLNGQEHPVRLATEMEVGSAGEIPQFNDGVWIATLAAAVGNFTNERRIPTIGEGKYNLCVSLGDAAGVPRISLPLREGSRRIYPVGRIQVLVSTTKDKEKE